MKVKLDQHFLKSRHVLLLEKNTSNITSKDIIFEIGPGDGRLTQFLLENSPKKLISIEMDNSLKKELDKIKERHPDNFEYIIGNGLEEIEKQFKVKKFNKLISNIPYSITEPLYYKICELKIPFVILLHGNTFYNIINDNTTKWHYFINSYYNIEKILDVAGNAFEPVAKTMSVLIKLKLKKNEDLSKEDNLIRILFNKKDRNSKNTIIYTLVDFGKTKKEAKEIVKNFKLTQRIENTLFRNLTNSEFMNILNQLKIELKI